MYETRNKTIIQKLALRDLKLKKLGNLFIMITIAVSAAMIMFMGLFPGSAKRDTQRQLAYSQEVIYYNVTPEQLQSLKEDRRLSFITLAKMGEQMEVEDYMIWQVYYDGTSQAIKTIDLVEGSLPEKENEVVVTKSYMKKIGQEARTGMKIRVPFLSGKTEEYVVSGFTKDVKNSSTYAIVHSKAYAERGRVLKKVNYDVLAKVKDAKTMNQETFLDTIRSIAADAGIPRSQVNENNYFVGTLSKHRLDADMLAVLIIGAIILAAGVIVIYSVFYISVTGKTREYGQLRTLGMTQRQIGKLVRREGLMLALRSAPVGLIAAGTVSWLLKPGGFSIPSALTWAAAVFVVILLTVRVSIMKQARIASFVSPVEASRYSAYTENGKKRTKKLYRKITPLSLAGMNSLRDRKKTFITMLSLGIGGVLFIGSVTFAASMDKDKYARAGVFQLGEFDLSISENAAATAKYGEAQVQMKTPFSEELRDRILRIPGVKGISTLKAAHIHYEYKDQAGQEDMVTPFTKEDAKDMREYIAEGTLDYEQLLSSNKILVRENRQAQEIYGWTFDVGDKVTIHYYDGEEKTKTYEIAGELEGYALGTTDGWFLLPEQVLEETMPGIDLTNQWIVAVDIGTRDKVEAPLVRILNEEPNLSMKTLREAEAQSRDSLNQFLLLIISIVLLVVLFSMINLVNTLITSFFSQKTEMAMLQSIGMTDSQLGRMIAGEGLVLAAGNIALSLIFGSLAGYGMCRLFNAMGSNYMDYRFPVLCVLLYAAAVILLPCVISFFMFRGFRRQSLVERLREV